MTAPADPLVGTALGDYHLGEILEQDPAGTLYRAEHVQLHRARACFVLDRSLAEHAPVVESFLLTARCISRSRHKNLVNIFDSGALPDGRPYYVMELLPGRTLDRTLADAEHPLSLGERLVIARQICVGLAAAHAVSVIHGVLSPSAVYVQIRPGEVPAVKVTRFGFVRDPTEAELVYASPELLSGAKVDERSDVYAAGLLLYELCTGAPPYRGDKETLRNAHLHAPVPSLLVSLPGAPSGLAAVVQRALAKAPEERYANGHELLAALDQTVSLADASRSQLDNKPIVEALRPRFSERARQWLGPRRGLFLAGALAVVGVGGALLLWPRRPPAVVAPKAYTMVQLRDLALQTLQAGLRESDASVRVQALRGLGQSPDVRYRGLIEPLLDDPVPAVREQAATVLGALGARASAPTLRAHADQATDRSVQVALAGALLKLGEPAGKKYLQTVLALEPAPGPQALAALLLAEHGDQEEHKAARDKLTALLAAKPQRLEPAVVTTILARLAQRGDSAAQQQLTALLPAQGALDLDGVAVAAALLRLEQPVARDRLRERATQPGPAQVAAATALCEADDPSFITVLREAADTGAATDRLIAAGGLGACGDKTDAEALATQLQGRGPGGPQRQALAAAVLRLASSDPQVLAEQGLSWAELALTDDNWTVRESAAALLGDSDPQRLLTRASRPPIPESATRTGDKSKPVKSATATDNPAEKSPQQLVDLLRSAAADKNSNVRLAALRSIGKLDARLQGSSGAEQARSLRTVLLDSADKGEPAERVVAAATLLRVGDTSRRAVLVDALHAPDAQVRKVAAQESSADKALTEKDLEPLLKDADFGVRFQAAQALAQRLDTPAPVEDPTKKKKGKAKAQAKALAKEKERLSKDTALVLREAVHHGGAEGVQAYALLGRLGEKLPSEQEAAKPSVADLLSNPEVLTRLTALEEVLRLPIAEAVPLLLKAARDPDAIMRFRVAEAAAGLAMPTQDPKVAPGLPVLRLLSTDEDVAVRSRALALYQALRPAHSDKPPRKVASQATVAPVAVAPVGPAVSTPVSRSDGGSPDGGPTDGGAAADAARSGPTHEGSEDKIGHGSLVVEEGSVVPFQIDGKPYEAIPDKPLSLTVGKHVVTYSSGQRNVTVTAGETASVKLLPSQAESLLNKGAAAARASDYRAAAKQLERAEQLCQKNHDEHLACVRLGGDLAYQLGVVYENLGQWSTAMKEYSRASQIAKGDPQASAQAAMRRLGTRLGRIMLYKVVDGECRPVEVWMTPGNHLVGVDGGERKPVELGAGETVELRTCP